MTGGPQFSLARFLAWVGLSVLLLLSLLLVVGGALIIPEGSADAEGIATVDFTAYGIGFVIVGVVVGVPTVIGMVNLFEDRKRRAPL